MAKGNVSHQFFTFIHLWIVSNYLVIYTGISPDSVVAFIFGELLLVALLLLPAIVLTAFLDSLVQMLKGHLSRERNCPVLRILFAITIALLPVFWLINNPGRYAFNEYESILFAFNSVAIFTVVLFYYSRLVNVLVHLFSKNN